MTLIATCLLWTAANAGEPVVAATDRRHRDDVQRKEAKQFFTGRRDSFANGVQVELLLPPSESEEMTWLADSVLGLSPTIYQRYLAEQAYRRGVAPPATLQSPADALSAAEAQSPGTSVLTVVPSENVEARLVRVDVAL